MENLNKNLDKIINLCMVDYDTKKIIDILNTGTIAEKQIAILELNEINTKEEAKMLMDNLTGTDGKIRQVTAYKILQLIPKYKNLFLDTDFYEIFAKAITDIDSNVCRMVIDSISNLKDNQEFSEYIANKMKDYIENSLEELSKISLKAKKYTSNKQYFKIYWAMEALTVFYKYLKLKDLKNILIKCSDITEYTIREKCAVILNNKFEDSELKNLKIKLSKDKNYYVRNV